MENSLLLVSSNSDDKAFAEIVARQAEVSLQVAPTIEDGIEYFAEHDPCLLFVDASNEAVFHQFEDLLQDKVGLFSDRVNPNMIHLISAEPLEKTPYITQSPIFANFLPRNFHKIEDSALLYGTVVKATRAERAFGLEHFFAPGARIQTIHFHRSGQKQDAVEAIKGYFTAAQFPVRIATIIANAVDELLMNAMFDAPVDGTGRQIFSNLPRIADMELKAQQTVDMRVGFDGSTAAVSVIDLFGSIDKQRLIHHISKIYTDDEYKVRTSSAGAGIGLATIFQQGASLLFVSEKSYRTEVTVFFRKCESFRAFKEQFHFLSTQFYF